MAEQLKTITELPVGDIVMRNRLRPVSPAGVAAIRASIEELGVMQDPIHVRKVPHRGGEFVLLVGAHRLTAAIEMGWETIPVTCWKCNDDFATLMELDDNLAGADLTALDTAVFLAERKRIYEKLHPETRQGHAGAAARHSATDIMSVATFTNSSAEKFGLTDRHIRRLVAAGTALSPAEIKDLRGAEKKIALNDLIGLSKIGDEAERHHVVASLAQGKAKNVSAARKVWKHGDRTPPKPSATDAAYRKLLDAWNRAPKAAQRQFVDERSEEIIPLLPGDDA